MARSYIFDPNLQAYQLMNLSQWFERIEYSIPIYQAHPESMITKNRFHKGMVCFIFTLLSAFSIRKHELLSKLPRSPKTTV